METPLVSKSSKLKISFQPQPPRLVRWGFHPSLAQNLAIGVTQDGVLCRISFANKKSADGHSAKTVLAAWKKKWPATEFVKDRAAAVKVAKDLFAHKAVPVVITGTKFQQDVWKIMLTIPPGKTLSYAEVAKRIRRPRAVRAVGTACGANPLALVVPCHRIIGSNGGLGGFGGGLPLKRRLLELEGVAA